MPIFDEYDWDRFSVFSSVTHSGSGMVGKRSDESNLVCSMDAAEWIELALGGNFALGDSS